MKIDFRNEYQSIALFSFTVTFAIYLFIVDNVAIVSRLPVFSASVVRFLLGLGLYLAIFRLLYTAYNRWIWKWTNYRHININGHWKYWIENSHTQSLREGYAVIEQDLYGIRMYGMNVGSGETKMGVATWYASDAYISYRSLHYDYDLFGERPGRITRLIRGRANVELMGSPSHMIMAGNYYEVPLHENHQSVVGSIMFQRIKSSELTDGIKAQFAMHPGRVQQGNE